MQFGDEKSTLFSKGLAIIDMVVIGAGVVSSCQEIG